MEGSKLAKWEKYSAGYEEIFEYDGSYRTWTELLIPVYSKVPIFNNNFDFSKAFRYGNRLTVNMKKGSDLELLLNNEYAKRGLENDNIVILGGDIDFNFKRIKECNINHHRLDNVSPMPVSGALNNAKNVKCNENMICFLQNLKDIVNSEYYTENVDVQRCQRIAYFNLFNESIKDYCLNVCFYGISKNDGKLYDETQMLIEQLLNSTCDDYDSYSTLAKKYWEIRRKILEEKYDIILDNEGQLKT